MSNDPLSDKIYSWYMVKECPEQAQTKQAMLSEVRVNTSSQGIDGTCKVKEILEGIDY